MKNILKLIDSTFIKLLTVAFVFALVTGANSDPTVQNKVEDPALLGTDLVGANPNLAFIIDLSGSMARNFGGRQIGNWDNNNVFENCGDQTPDDTDERIDIGFCAENIANLTVCASQNCTEDGHRCRTLTDLQNQEACILEATGNSSITDTLPNGQSIACIYNVVCGNNNSICGETSASCGNGDETNHAAWAMEAAAGLTQCSTAANCQLSGDDDPSCNTSGDINRFFDCMDNLQTIIDDLYSDSTLVPTILRPENCTGGTFPTNSSCDGVPEFGSSRMDTTLNTILNVLDSDDSLETELCVDEGDLWDDDGSSSNNITCREYLETPFRDISDIIFDGGTITAVDDQADNLPSPSGLALRDEILTQNDADQFKSRFLPMSYSGNTDGTFNGDACDPSGSVTLIDNQDAFRMGTGGFQQGVQSIRDVWDFFRNQTADGGTPLAHIIGFDDSADPTAADDTQFVRNDAILAFNNALPDDPGIDCRPQFLIVVTDGDDSCAGDCSENAAACNGSATASNNSNRRSSINAVSKLRTHFSRINGGTGVDSNIVGQANVKKEVIVFVVGLGIDDPNAIRALNAMALTGGTHTKGIIKHIDPATGDEFGRVSVEPLTDCLDLTKDLDHPDNANASALCGTNGDEYQVFRDIAKAEGLNSATPVDALLTTCGTPDQTGPNSHCTFGSTDVFNNVFFDTGMHDAGGTITPVPAELEGFAFLANTPEELADAIQDILVNIEDFTTSGVAPSAPQSSVNVSARDRMFLSILTPMEDERLWQGRLALYGFIDSKNPDSPGSRTIIRRPASAGEVANAASIADISIFSSEGTLDEDAELFYWEAGKLLAERDIDSDPRNLLTVIPESITGSFINTGDIVDFDNTIAPASFGISSDDITDPIQTFCEDPTDGFGDCDAICDPESDGIDDITIPACITCVTNCLRDRVVDFMIGNTGIRPAFDPGDPLGASTTGGQVDTGNPNPTIGYDCFDTENNPTGTFDTCALRLGDIFHATPVLVGSPSPLFFDVGFQEFALNFLKRAAGVYAGGNAGFLYGFHAGNFVNAELGDAKTNPFTLEDEEVPFFNEGSGLELFGFAPPSFLYDTRSEFDPEILPSGPSPDYRLGDFKTFVLEDNEQRAFFDGAPTIGDIWIDAYKNGIDGDDSLCPDGDGVTINTPDGNIDFCGREWHTLLVAGFRSGGAGFTALDITNLGCGDSDGVDDETDVDCSLEDKFLDDDGGPSYPTHLWTQFDNDYGNSWSQPTFGRVQLQVDDGISDPITVDRWVMFAGGGKDPLDEDAREGGVDFGRGFYAIDLTTGKTIFKFHKDDPIDNDDNSIANTDDMVCEMAARVSAFDINADGFVDLVLGGDTCGRLWRFDVSMPLKTSSSLSQTGIGGSAVIEAPDWTGSVGFCTGDCVDGSDNLRLPPFTDDGNPDNDSDMQSIYFAPTVVFDDIGRRHVIFVTGNRFDATKLADFDDMGTEDPADDEPIPGTFEFGKLFNFVDDFVPAFLAGGSAINPNPLRTEQDLVDDDQVIKIKSFTGGTIPDDLKAFQVDPVADFNSGRGEFLVEFPDNIDESDADLSFDPMGERGFGSPTVINRVLIFTTFAPDTTDDNPCTAAFGEGRLFAIDFLTGQSALGRIPGARQSVLQGVTSDSDAANVAGVKVAEGIPSAAQITFGVRGSAILTIAFSGSPASGGAQFLIWELPPFPSRTQTLFWEEII